MLKKFKKVSSSFLAFLLGTAIIVAPTTTKANNSVLLPALKKSNQVAQFAAPPPPPTSRQVTERSLNVCSSIPEGWVAIYVSSRVCGVGVMTIKNLSQEPIGSKLLMCSARSKVPEGWVIIYDGDAKYDTQAICRVVTIEKISK